MKNVKLGSIVITAFISAIFTIIPGAILSYLSLSAPTLKYEILPISHFNRDSIALSIIHIRILNDGTKEAEDIAFTPHFGQAINMKNYSFEKSSSSIQINRKLDSATGSFFYAIPYLNPKEQVVCSFLVNTVMEESSIGVDLRGRGLNGVKTDSEDKSIFAILFFTTIGMLSLTLGIITYIVIYQRKIIRYNQQLNAARQDYVLKLEAKLASNGISFTEEENNAL